MESLEKKISGLESDILKYKGLFETMPSAVVIYEADNEGSDFIIKEINRAAEEIESVSKDQAIGKRLTEICRTFEDFGVSDAIKRVWKTGKSEFLPPAVYKNSQCASGWREGWAYKLSSGEVAIVYDDISERVQLAKALKENDHRYRAAEEKHRLILENSREFIALYDKNAKLLYANPAWLKAIKNIGPKSENFFTRIHPDDMDRLKKAWKVMIAGKGHITNLEYRYWIDESNYRYIETTVREIEDNGEKLYYIISRDVTRQKRFEEGLKRGRDLTRQYLDVVGSMLISINRRGDVILVNKKGCDILGYETKEILWKNWFDNFIPERFVEDVKTVSRSLLRGEIESFKYHESPVITRHGNERLIAWNHTVLKNPRGEIVGHFSSGEDITDKKRIEDQIRQSQKMEAIGTLAGGIAHDFNNLLEIIIGNTELAMSDIPEHTTAHTSLTEVQSACMRARGVVKQILAFSQSKEETLRPIELSQVILDSLSFIQSSIPINIDIRSDRVNNVGHINGEATQINQMLVSLFSNASYAMKESGGVLEVILEQVQVTENNRKDFPHLAEGEYARLSVRDSGHGIDAKAIERIFDPYYTTKSEGEGSGMGLYIVQGIVKKHRGEIAVKSELGKGTTFQIYFPIIEGKSADEIDVDDIISNGNEHILFIDDEPSMADIYQHMFERLGYTVTSRTSSIEALEAFRAQPEKFDLVVTDQTMPHLTGQMLAREMKRLRPDIPIILCAGHNDILDKEKALEMGVCAFIKKPIIMGEIGYMIEDILQKK